MFKCPVSWGFFHPQIPRSTFNTTKITYHISAIKRVCSISSFLTLWKLVLNFIKPDKPGANSSKNFPLPISRKLPPYQLLKLMNNTSLSFFKCQYRKTLLLINHWSDYILTIFCQFNRLGDWLRRMLFLFNRYGNPLAQILGNGDWKVPGKSFDNELDPFQNF